MTNLEKAQAIFCDCVKYRNGFIFCGDGSRFYGYKKNINVVKIVELDNDLVRVSVNLIRDILPSSVISRVERMNPKCDLNIMEITSTSEEVEIILAWLWLMANGNHDAERPTDILSWQSGDYAWTRAALLKRNGRR